MESALDPALKDNVRLLGDLLSEVIEQDQGPEFIDKIVAIRTLAKQARSHDNDDPSDLIQALHALADDDIKSFTFIANLYTS